MNNNILKVLREAGLTFTEEANTTLTGAAFELYESWKIFLGNAFANYQPIYLKPSLFIDKQTVEQARYVEHFPHQIYVSQNLKYKNKTHRFITPAACLHVYPQINFKNSKKKTISILTTAACARFENNTYDLPFRTPNFTMTELVTLGNPATVEIIKKDTKIQMQDMFEHIGLKGKFITATDAFFMDKTSGSKIMQKLKELKQEFVGEIRNQKVALASLNYHEDYFAKCFNIKANGSFVYSFCAAFGIERLVAFSILTWGKTKNKWPKEFRNE